MCIRFLSSTAIIPSLIKILHIAKGSKILESYTSTAVRFSANENFLFTTLLAHLRSSKLNNPSYFANKLINKNIPTQLSLLAFNYFHEQDLQFIVRLWVTSQQKNIEILLK